MPTVGRKVTLRYMTNVGCTGKLVPSHTKKASQKLYVLDHDHCEGATLALSSVAMPNQWLNLSASGF